MLSEKEKKFVDLANKVEQIKLYLKETSEEMESLGEEIGVGHMFQDPETMVVFQVVRPKGTFVTFPHVGYKRTSLPGEKGGSNVLAKKEAKENGFMVY